MASDELAPAGTPLLAALRYRTDWTTVHSGEARISDPTCALRGGMVQEPSVLRAGAVARITAAHQQVLHRDPALIALVEAVGGRGDTLMDKAKGNKHVARRSRLMASPKAALPVMVQHD